ncbi:hypothetical protein [Sphaerotilus mobilis]|uniref:Uncharacterized protein n=1 Tax=Sphaerotilus mobilis TaxID=47994 RepID=A0A4Q7LSX7_9BURK|nr:hypothetical protein [Sphaerotilus mobilis]RZS57108.1 hypothetical protein EV685_1672 [Sphaerotilus mobilis]
MPSRTSFFPPIRATAFLQGLVLGATVVLSGVAVANDADKSVAVEHVPAFPALERWVSGRVTGAIDAPLTRVQTIPLSLAGAPQAETYQPLPVILGLPELPLIGAGAGRTDSAWSAGFNYQGLALRQLVLDGKGTQHQLRPLSAGMPAGARFKLRITATFDAVAEVDQVVGDAWYGQRVGQVYPKKGMSVSMKAGETVDLPLGAQAYFVMGRAADQRLVLSVRHPKAIGSARSAQPAYRQDGRNGSTYLQLVPSGSHPVIEQQLMLAR